METRTQTKQIMNEKTDTKETEDNGFMDGFMIFIEYALNKYMPLAMVCFICFYTFGFISWEPYFILGLMLFSNSYNFKCGYAHSCLDNGFEGDNEDTL